MGAFTQGALGGLQIAEKRRQFDATQQQEQFTQAFTALKNDFNTGIAGIQNAYAKSPEKPTFSVEYLDMMTVGAQRLDDMAAQLGQTSGFHMAQFKQALNSPTGTEQATAEGTIAGEAALGKGKVLADATGTDLVNALPGVNIPPEEKPSLWEVDGETKFATLTEATVLADNGAVVHEYTPPSKATKIGMRPDGSLVMATDAEFAQGRIDGSIVVPTQAGLIKTLEIVADQAGIDRAFLKPGAPPLSKTDATTLINGLRNVDPFWAMFTTKLGEDMAGAGLNLDPTTREASLNQLKSDRERRIKELENKE